MHKWLLLGGAIVSEVSASLALQAALHQPAWYVLVGAGYLASFGFLAAVLRARMPVLRVLRARVPVRHLLRAPPPICCPPASRTASSPWPMPSKPCRNWRCTIAISSISRS